jgi:hypothetical protein
MEVRQRAPEGKWLKLWLVGLLIPLGAAGLGFAVRHVTTRRQIERLERAAVRVTGSDRASSEAVAAQERVIIARLDEAGATIFRTAPVEVAKGWRGQMLDAADAQLPPWPGREEVRAALAGKRTFARYWGTSPWGSVLIQTLAQPVAGGGALYIMRGSQIDLQQQPGVLGLIGVLSLVVTMGLRWLSRRKPPAAGP